MRVAPWGGGRGGTPFTPPWLWDSHPPTGSALCAEFMGWGEGLGTGPPPRNTGPPPWVLTGSGAGSERLMERPEEELCGCAGVTGAESSPTQGSGVLACAGDSFVTGTEGCFGVLTPRQPRTSPNDCTGLSSSAPAPRCWRCGGSATGTGALGIRMGRPGWDARGDVVLVPLLCWAPPASGDRVTGMPRTERHPVNGDESLVSSELSITLQTGVKRSVSPAKGDGIIGVPRAEHHSVNGDEAIGVPKAKRHPVNGDRVLGAKHPPANRDGVTEAEHHPTNRDGVTSIPCKGGWSH